MIEGNLILALGMPGGMEWLVIALLGLLIFGRRLPEVGKSLGRSIVEFKKGLKGADEELDRDDQKGDPEILPPPTDTTQSTASKSDK